MKFKVDEKDGVTVLTLKGTIYDEPKLNELRDELKKIVHAGTRRVIVDLGDVPGMAGDRGLSILLEVLISLKKVGGKRVLARIIKKVNELLLLARLTELFECYPSMEEAVKALKS